MSRAHPLHRVEQQALASWLEHARILESHVWHLPENSGPGLLVTMPAGWGRPLIDGNHRAARALKLGLPFAATVLSEDETYTLLRRSMHPAIADDIWRRLLQSKSDTDHAVSA